MNFYKWLYFHQSKFSHLIDGYRFTNQKLIIVISQFSIHILKKHYSNWLEKEHEKHRDTQHFRDTTLASLRGNGMIANDYRELNRRRGKSE